ncbi:SNF2 family N-terminal domain-containing protein [Copromyces sp. CBS 386.78]|nr:SNF2 family N-terminal domain-containing protein [Copromyces sp. CBS 386.78]
MTTMMTDSGTASDSAAGVDATRNDTISENNNTPAIVNGNGNDNTPSHHDNDDNKKDLESTDNNTNTNTNSNHVVPAIDTSSTPTRNTNNDAGFLDRDQSPLSSISSPLSEPDNFDFDSEPIPSILSPQHHQDAMSTTSHHTRDGDTPELDQDGQPPAKRRRVRETTPNNHSRKPKPESPPWKKFEAEGPTTIITEDGRRKSGRVNPVLLGMKPSDKKVTRKAMQTSPVSNKSSAASSSRKPAPASSSSKHAPAKMPPPPPKAPARKSATTHDTRPSASRSRRRSTSPRRPATPPKPPAVGTRRSTRQAVRASYDDGQLSPGASRATPRITLKVRPPLTVIPLVHPSQAHVRPKLGPNFEEYFARAQEIPVEEGGQQIADEGPEYTDEMALQDAKIILRVEKEVEPGGLLAPDRCSAFEPEAEEEPPRQWAHLDHLTKAMTNFRKLMYREQQLHMQAAKRIAIACEVEWRRRNPQPKTAEEIELEEIEASKAKWRQVIKAFAGTWENVRVEVNRRRLVEWEAEEQRRVKAALNQAVNLSEQKLQQRQAQVDGDEITDEDEDEDDEDLESGMPSVLGDDEESDEHSDAGSDEMSDENDEDENEDNMSSSEDDDDKKSAASDEVLTQEELRAKYADLPTLDKTDENKDIPKDVEMADASAAVDGSVANEDDTSDESVDMDDDLGSSEEESDEDDEDEDDEEEEESDDEPAGLLGLFFGKSELKKLKEEAVTEEPSAETAGDVEMADAPAVVDAKPQINGHPDEAPKTNGIHTNEQRAISQPEGTDEEVSLLEVPDNKALESTQTTTEPDSGVAKKDSLVNGGPLKQPNGTVQSENHAIPSKESIDGGDDITMVDAPPTDKLQKDTVSAPSIEAPPPNPRHDSQETVAATDMQSQSQTQSPKTTDTKPTDIDTPHSELAISVQKPDSRQSSPQPTTPTVKTEIPFLLRGTLREYQHHGLDWLAGLYANTTNGILADEMGLGKTIQTIALLAHLACHHEVWGPHLVIVPTSVMLNWEMEFKKWCPGFKILTYYGNQEERKRKRQGWNNDDVWNVCITSYQMVLQDQQVFRRRRWHYMILDEAHNIKNFKSQRWQTLLGFNTQARLLLTGTPLQNNLTELWSLLYFLAPPENGEGGFVDLTEFHNWFARPESQILESGREQLDDEARAIIAKLHKVLRPYLLRRLKADVEKQMPAKVEHVEFCRLSKRQRELYDGFLSRSDTRETLQSGNYMSIINCLMQLRKVCNHPDLFVDRPIMTSFRMSRSVPADYEWKEKLIRNRLLITKPMTTVNLSFLNMIPTEYEDLSKTHTERIAQLNSHRILLDLREAQKVRANNAYTALDPASVKSNLVYLESAARWGRFEELQHCVYINALRRQQRPIYGKRLTEFLTLDTHLRPYKPRPRVPAKIMSWFEEDSFLLHNAIPTLQQRAEAMEMTITKFACVTPAVVTGPEMNRFLLGERGIQLLEDLDLKLSAPVKYAPYMPPQPPPDPWHEARMRLTIQFPDKRLLQYDCGKLQALDKLLRKLQAGGHRALIFTQMTKVLDILEQFLNIHGHKYLRLDGATKVEQRQILTDRFNHDPRILCFILSTRSGGLGINLTGADTVIFYDQDWNPAMDKQCQDRCHRIGQTRDVHIYRLVSEHTIEANILRKASQKQMLDDVVIQEGEFTTDYFNRLSVRDVLGSNGEVIASNEDDVAANLAMDRVLGGPSTAAGPGGEDGTTADGSARQPPAVRNVGRVLEMAEDREDVDAAKAAEKEIMQDEADFGDTTRPGTPGDAMLADLDGGQQVGLGLVGDAEQVIEYNAWGERIHTIDEYMLRTMAKALEGTPLELPRDRSKKGRDRNRNRNRNRNRKGGDSSRKR